MRQPDYAAEPLGARLSSNLVSRQTKGKQRDRQTDGQTDKGDVLLMRQPAYTALTLSKIHVIDMLLSERVNVLKTINIVYFCKKLTCSFGFITMLVLEL